MNQKYSIMKYAGWHFLGGKTDGLQDVAKESVSIFVD
jgi:hypothetical protein